MSSEVSKQEYLKRYLGSKKNAEGKRKKKLTAKVANISRFKIIDQDIDINSINLGDKGANADEVDDEKPIVAEVIDDRPLEVKVKELYESSRWKKFGGNDNSQPDISLSSTNIKVEQKESNLSPLRQSDRSSKRTRHDSDSDISPPRHQKERISKKNRDSFNNDLSPPRHAKGSPRETRHDSDSDISPPRSLKCDSRKRHSSGDLSPPRHRTGVKSSRRGNSSDDVSPPRRSNKNNRRRNDSDSDISPPRYNDAKKGAAKLSKGTSNSEGSSKHSMKGKRNEKMVNNSDSDMSPPRSTSSRKSMENIDKKPRKTLSGLKAGLQDSATLRQETEELRKREKNHINMLDDAVSGRNAETVLRDRSTGLRRDLDQERQVKDEENKKVEEHQKKYSDWGKGIEQTQNKMEKFVDDVYEMSKPLARYRDDEDLDERLKAVIHDDDPMSEYIKKKKQKVMPTVPLYSGPLAPPNRFGILPGYRWDGVDRTNGFEKKYFEKINNSKATQEESYLWSIQDM